MYPSRQAQTSSRVSASRDSMIMSRTLLAVILKMSWCLASSGSSFSAMMVSIISLLKRSEMAEVLLGFFPKVRSTCSFSGSAGSGSPNRPALGL